MNSSLELKPWTVVLAGGEGARLRSLTRALHGSDLPKQFATIQPGRSLLATTLARAARWSDPERTLVVVAEHHIGLAGSQLTDGRTKLVPQPKNLGTGPGVLLPLAHVVAKAPEALVVLVPSDHYVRDEEPFFETVRRAQMMACAHDSVVLIGAVPESAETQYGWIRTGKELGGCRCVVGFREKPSASMAARLLGERALWNTFILVGRARALWELAKKHLPQQGAQFELYKQAVDTEDEAQARARLYEHLSSADFCKDVLEKATGLLVVPLAPCGWSDWGTPVRVFHSLEGTPDAEQLIRRIRAASAAKNAELEVQQLTGT